MLRAADQQPCMVGEMVVILKAFLKFLGDITALLLAEEESCIGDSWLK